VENSRFIYVYTHAENLVTNMYVCRYIYTYVCAMEDGGEVALRRCIFTNTQNLVTHTYIYVYKYMEYEGQVPVRMCSRSKFRYIHIHVCMCTCICICIHVCFEQQQRVLGEDLLHFIEFCYKHIHKVSFFTLRYSPTHPPTHPHPHAHIFVHVV